MIPGQPNFVDYLDILLPVVTKLINASLYAGVFPRSIKGRNSPTSTKKEGIDKHLYKNYRPISNLTFISKILEKVVNTRLRNHLSEQYLLETFQKACRAHHSAETSLLRLVNDLRCSVDKGNLAVLLLLDLFATFNTVDHDVLLSRMSSDVGLTGVPLQ